MKARVIFDQDGTHDTTIEGYRITTQIVALGYGVGIVCVFNKKGKRVKTYHYSKIYSIEVTH